MIAQISLLHRSINANQKKWFQMLFENLDFIGMPNRIDDVFLILVDMKQAFSAKNQGAIVVA
ncbi:MAG: hypothetical protein R2877_03620 [Bdellovibrionota bacterium]